MVAGEAARRMEYVTMASRTERPMIGAVKATGWANADEPALVPTKIRTAMNEAN